MRFRDCIVLLLLLSACATTEPSPRDSMPRSPRLANLQRAAKLPWKDEGWCVVREASQPWAEVVEQCFHALDTRKIRFRDTERRCPVASADAASLEIRVTLYGLEIPPESGPRGQPLLDIHASLPLSTAGIAAAADVLEQVAVGARAFWGHVTPFRAGVGIARQTSDPVRKPQVPPRGLPALKLPDQLPSPEIPHRLGWLNYWSAATAEAIGFPDVPRDAELLKWARLTATGGWFVQLTETPLDLDTPTHLEALLRAYERFPAIGGRSTS